MIGRCLALSIAVFHTVGISAAEETYHLPFDYNNDSPTGPLRWQWVNTTGNSWEQYIDHEFHNLDRASKNRCHWTRRQSPLNLVANAVCEDTHEILTRKIKEDEDCQFDSLTFSITPHTLRADFPNSDDTCLRPEIDLPIGYPFTWYVHHIEIHLRAEHVLDGRRYDGEMQMYHLGREDQKRELASVNVLLDASGYEDNAKLQQYIDEWEKLESANQDRCSNNSTRRTSALKNVTATTMKSPQPIRKRRQLRSSSSSSLPQRALDKDEHKLSRATLENVTEPMAPRRKMFPYDIWPSIHFYRYKGSLTAPPCTEFVSHRVLDEPLVISKRQFKTLARLLNSYTNSDCENDSASSPTGETFRPLQTLNHAEQNLTHCTLKDFTYRLYPLNQV